MPTFILTLILLLGPPRLDGLMTHYDWCDSRACVFRSGEAFRLDAPYCAVDDALWDELEGARLYVQAGTRMFSCTVADTGWLSEAGRYDGRPFVLDLPAEFFRLVTGGEDTQEVRVWR